MSSRDSTPLLFRVLAYCAALVYVAASSAAVDATGIARLGCATNVSVPPQFHRSFYVNTTDKVSMDAAGIRLNLQANLSIVSDAVLLYGTNLLTTQPYTGVVTRECILTFLTDTDDHYLIAMKVGLSETTSCCLRFKFKPTYQPDSYWIAFSFQIQERDRPVCDTKHHPPNQVITTGKKVTNTSVMYSCPRQGVIPVDLLQSPVRSRCNVLVTHQLGIPCFEGFISSGWFVVRRLTRASSYPFEPATSIGALRSPFCTTRRTTSTVPSAQRPCRLRSRACQALRSCGRCGRCKLNHRSLKTTASSPSQVVFGDALTETVTACGWWARVGDNLTYVVHWNETMVCPPSMAHDPSRVVLPNYWGLPSPTQSPTPSQSPSQAASSSQSPTPTHTQSPSQSPSQPPSQPRVAASKFHLFGLSGPAAVGTVVGVCVAAGVAVVAAALALRRRYLGRAGGVAYAQLSKTDVPEAAEDSTPRGDVAARLSRDGFELAQVPSARDSEVNSR